MRGLSLRVVAIPATTQPARGALFYFEGGPGGAASESAARVNEIFARTLVHRDVVLVDQRGTGGSNRLACPDERVSATDARAVNAYLLHCFARRPAAAAYTTAAAVDDLERVRRALGYGRVDVYGSSYGGTAAQAFLERHPRSVRTLILDSTSLPSVPVYERSARNAEHALRLVFARCAAERACTSPRRDLLHLLARPPRGLSSDDVARTVEALATSPIGAARIPFVLHEAVSGRTDPLVGEFEARVGRTLDDRSRLAMFWVTLCNEPWAGFDVDATERAARDSFFAHAAVSRARFFRAACRAVPKPSNNVARAHGPHGVPVLLLAGSADPRDPPANLRGWKHAYPNGRLVVVPTGSHGVIGLGCLSALAARFVERGSARGLDTSCVREIEPPPFQRP